MNLLQCYDEGRDELIAIGDRYGLRVIHPDWKGGYDYLAGISMLYFSFQLYYNLFFTIFKNGIWPLLVLFFFLQSSLRCSQYSEPGLELAMS
jgi:hypothetical protein